MFKKTIILFTLILLFLTSNAFAENSNLIKNAEFENTTSDYPNDWFEEMWHVATDYTEISIIEFDGSNVLQISNNFENDARLCQNISVKGNKTYKLSGYIFADDIEDGQGANLSFEDVMETTEGVFNTGGNWQYVEIYGKTSLFQRNVKIFVRIGGYGNLSTGTAMFDKITFEQVDNVPSDAIIHSIKKRAPPKEEKEGIKFLTPSILITLLMLFVFLILRKRLFKQDEINEYKDIDNKKLLWLVIIIGTLIRVLLAITIRGYPNDISCWIGWSHAAADSGLFKIYELDIFLDYPPGYMYILYPIGLLMKLIGNVPDRLSWLLVKIPPITADILLSVIIFKAAKKKIGQNKALLLSAVYFLNPAVILNSSAWGQIDGVLALFVILYILALYDRKFTLAGIFLGVGVLLKLQMVLFAPLYLTAAWSYFKEKKDKKIFKEIGLGILSGILTITILVLPFYAGGGKEFSWIFKIYTGALDTYSTVSLNACNLWALLGGMWKPIEETLLGVSYATLTNIGLILSVLVFLVIGFIDTKKEHIFMHAALLITGIFILSGKMHERYMFTAIALLIFSFIYTRRKSSYILLAIFSATQFMNTSLVLANEYIFSNDIWTILISIAAILGYAYMIYVSINMYKNKQEKPFGENTQSNISEGSDIKEYKRIKINHEQCFLKKLNKYDAILMTALTLVYAAIAFINLGSLSGPQTNFEVKSKNQVIIVDFGEEKLINELWYFRGKATSGAKFIVGYSNEIDGDYQTLNYLSITHGGLYEDDAEEMSAKQEIKEKYAIAGDIDKQIIFSNYPDILKWFKNNAQITARYAKITLEAPMIYIFEMAFKDTFGNTIPIKEVIPVKVDEDTPYQLLFDEQETLPESITYMNGTYFDEIYHAGTAWEHINYVDPYETTHPPLGKVIMSWGIMIFGTNTFGWRFMGTLFGVLMVPLMYLFAKMIFKKSRYAFIAAFLFTFDFMHFTQTRIATIDTYGVFFIMLMYLFMGIYYQMNYNKAPLIKTLIPLGLCGISFGLGAASKWICLYAGMGLGVIFFITMYQRWREYEYCRNDGIGIAKSTIDDIQKKYIRKTIITLAFCILFFIIIPAIIYTISDISILKIGPSKCISYVWRNQVNMYNFHSGLSSSHPYASPWYEWPFLIKPMWYYSNEALRKTGVMSSIAAFGNPAVWWVGTIAMLYLFIDTYLKKKPTKTVLFIIIGFLSQYLPWVIVPRSMFIYHYFASVPFFIIAIVMAIRKLEIKKKINTKYIIIYLSIVLLLFIFFYPVLSGTPIPSQYGKLMKWLPTWWFTY